MNRRRPYNCLRARKSHLQYCKTRTAANTILKQKTFLHPLAQIFSQLFSKKKTLLTTNLHTARERKKKQTLYIVDLSEMVTNYLSHIQTH